MHLKAQMTCISSKRIHQRPGHSVINKLVNTRFYFYRVPLYHLGWPQSLNPLYVFPLSAGIVSLHHHIWLQNIAGRLSASHALLIPGKWSYVLSSQTDRQRSRYDRYEKIHSRKIINGWPQLLVIACLTTPSSALSRVRSEMRETQFLVGRHSWIY